MNSLNAAVKFYDKANVFTAAFSKFIRNYFTNQNTFTSISRRIRWAGHVARMG